MKTTAATLQKQLDRLTKKFESKHDKRFSPSPTIKLFRKGDRGFSIRYAGRANYFSNIVDIMAWQLADKTEAQGTVRHEFAHLLKSFLYLRGSSHGRGFKRALQMVSGKAWERDMHWNMTPAISQARPKVNRKKTVAIVSCTNKGCTWQWKTYRVPSYIQRGLTACPRCKTRTLGVERRSIHV